MRKLGIYVQVPFCQTRCTYCNFHTGVVASSRFAPYVEAVCGEIRGHRELLRAAGVGRGAETGEKAHSQEWLCHQPVADTVYIGGGTPSLLDPVHLQNTLDAIRETFEVERPGRLGRSSAAPLQESVVVRVAEVERLTSPTRSGQAEREPYDGSGTGLVEVTLEADPETVETGKAAAWVTAGINRVSFGVQSFVDKELVAAGRMHRREDIYRAVPILRAAGIRNISFDLIAGLPHQTRESWRQSLEELIALGPEHVSVYLLEIDEGSRLGAELLGGGKKYSAGAVPSEDEMAEFYELAQKRLGAAGYHHYEISNWAKPGFESKHNLKYWQREPYLGFGAGAHSFSGTERWANAHDAAAYVGALQGGRLPVEQHEVLTAEGALEEELFLGLRQLDGIDVGRIELDYGVALAGRFDPLAMAGLVKRDGSMVKLAPDKLSVSNEVFVELMR
ncbi:MAG TPA: radical SAM family heme chaperone HemW [Candidatus Acidoferrum sp.]|nr:radical SAM family heme chaperone HemW [Candidatus Acidoferrum sp.]